MRVLVTSERDPASLTIRTVLVDGYGFSETGDEFEGNPVYSHGSSSLLITSARDLIHCDHLEQHFDAEVFIFCSRHKSESGRPALLVHSTGNLTASAEYGGNPYQVSYSAASLVAVALRRLYAEREKRGLSEFDVTLEVTHHGPTSMKTPLLFVELGSDESHWSDVEGAGAVAAAVMDCIRTPFEETSAIGFGGSHYASKFNRLVLERGIRIGHMAPKYTIEGLTEGLIHQMIEHAHERVTMAIVDWKGMNSAQKAHLFPMLEAAGIEIVRANRI